MSTIVEVTNYYAKTGQAAAVLAQRKRASEVRARLGLSSGRILVKLEGAGPDVRWECTYTDRAAYEHDMAVRQDSAEFNTIRAGMTALVDKFERHLQQESV
jgi:hypothetical protein